MASWTRLSVRVESSSLPAQQIAERVGRPPSRSANAGDLGGPRSAAVHDRASCVWNSPVEPKDRPQEHVRWAIELLRSAHSALLPVAGEIAVDIRVSYSSSTGQGAFALTGHDLTALGALGVQLNVDLYPEEAER
jgi:hypothetical protein